MKFIPLRKEKKQKKEKSSKDSLISRKPVDSSVNGFIIGAGSGYGGEMTRKRLFSKRIVHLSSLTPPPPPLPPLPGVSCFDAPAQCRQ